ncbi:hypothetical protein ACOSQ4_028751 [Xanthoceras sorbifolium]
MIKRRIRKIERDEKCWLTSAKGIGSQWDSARSQAAQWDSDRSQLNNFKPLATAHFGAAALGIWRHSAKGGPCGANYYLRSLQLPEN